MDPAQDAIKAALQGDWKKAIELNKQIVKKDAKDIDSLIRLAHACFESGNLTDSKKYSAKALKIDPDNKLAQRCASRTQASKKDYEASSAPKRTNLKAFLEIPGKTRLVRLVHLGEPKTIATLCSGEQVKLTVSSRKAVVETDAGEHIGRLPDDIAIKLSTSKSARFWAAVKLASANEVSIMIHEQEI